MPMENSARLFYCAGCHRQVIVCRQCDRGQCYCGRECAQSARTASLRAANHRYQKTYRGRLHHAQRQQRYRLRQREQAEKVTYQGSQETPPHDVLTQQRRRMMADELPAKKSSMQCHFCHRSVCRFLRRAFLSAFYDSYAANPRRYRHVFNE